MEKVYLCIDLKSFYASVECVERGLDPLNTNLVVADPTRTEKTICLAISPSLKQYGIGGRARLCGQPQGPQAKDKDPPAAWCLPTGLLPVLAGADRLPLPVGYGQGPSRTPYPDGGLSGTQQTVPGFDRNRLHRFDRAALRESDAHHGRVSAKGVWLRGSLSGRIAGPFGRGL